MKLLLLLCLPSLFIGCASTEVCENGQRVFRTHMNAQFVDFRTPMGTRLIVHGMNHSEPTRAGGSVIGTAGTALTGVAASVLLR